ncbi:hypothetical protein RCL1_007614 [Eukaryota sp. TZLM3-RCL]
MNRQSHQRSSKAIGSFDKQTAFYSDKPSFFGRFNILQQILAGTSEVLSIFQRTEDQIEERRKIASLTRDLTEQFFLDPLLFVQKESLEHIWLVNRKTVKFVPPTRGTSLVLSDDGQILSKKINVSQWKF